ncbi:four helix bundle protein [Methylocaldum sp. GT1TLB]|jgi:four helix bundle protein|uniref:four helix bundle protein n=1 Tax=Methylocaldum sp. GT1TLB TaxID=3438965 RepID=UPI003DA06409
MRNFRELKVWERSHQPTLIVYHVTKRFPPEELYGLMTQMRRSSASIPANIAEGCGRSGDAELARFLQIAMGSASELEYQALLAGDLRYLDKATCDQLGDDIMEIKRMLAGFLKTLRQADS